MKPEVNYTLYLVTDSELMSTSTVEESVELAIRGGVTMVQIREKTTSSRGFYETAHRVREITKRHNVPLIVNDRVDIALAVDADGVHVGQSDLSTDIVRRIIGSEKILGVSVSNLIEALEARDRGADYLGVGAMYSTGTKDDAIIVSMEELERIRTKIQLPIVVIGGINKETIPDFKKIGIDGIAVVSAIISQRDISGAARELFSLFMQGCA